VIKYLYNNINININIYIYGESGKIINNNKHYKLNENKIFICLFLTIIPKFTNVYIYLNEISKNNTNNSGELLFTTELTSSCFPRYAFEHDFFFLKLIHQSVKLLENYMLEC